MTLPTQAPRRSRTHDSDGPNKPPVKRVRIEAATTHANDSSSQTTFIRRHPLGVRPSGNLFTSKFNLKDSCGLFALLPDELLVQLLDLLEAPDLLRLGSTCRALFAFASSDELWRALFVQSHASGFSWQGSWRSTCLGLSSIDRVSIDCSNLFSDVLHRPFFCAHVPLRPFTEDIPLSNEIPRLADLSFEEFAAKWTDRPFVLIDPVKQWPIYKSWSTERLLETYRNVPFRAEAVDWPLQTYTDYMGNNSDESPLYLFDSRFAEKMNLVVSNGPEEDANYWPPTCFGFDYFSILGCRRPDHRWLIIGPERSGSTFHKDPNSTSAWNAVLKGSKYWIMFPSSPSLPPPPGVYVSDDQSEITSPLSIAEWLLEFHSEARKSPGCIEGICNEGEVLHVPSGWYHLVLNLEPSIAVTQNFVPKSRVAEVLHFLRDQKQSVSGFSDEVEDPYQLFVDRLHEHDPQLLQESLEKLEVLSNGPRTRWETLTRPAADGEVESAGFSFGFGGDEDDEDD